MRLETRKLLLDALEAHLPALLDELETLMKEGERADPSGGVGTSPS